MYTLSFKQKREICSNHFKQILFNVFIYTKTTLNLIESPYKTNQQHEYIFPKLHSCKSVFSKTKIIDIHSNQRFLLFCMAKLETCFKLFPLFSF